MRLPPWLAFEKTILVKSEAAAAFSRGFLPARVMGDTIVIGTATDPYQPAEKLFGITRGILERLLGYRGLKIGIITKSPLVVRDADLLLRLSALHELKVNISLATLDRKLVRRLEARSPAPTARLRALKALTDRGIDAGLMVAPIVPGITDGRAALRALLAAGKEAGARYAYGSALRLGPAARNRFLPHLAREFPALRERYARRYGRSDKAGKDYETALADRFRALKEELGYAVSGRDRGQNGTDPTTKGTEEHEEARRKVSEVGGRKRAARVGKDPPPLTKLRESGHIKRQFFVPPRDPS